MGRSKKNVRVTSDGIHAEIHEIWTCVAPAGPPLCHAAVNPCPQSESQWEQRPWNYTGRQVLERDSNWNGVQNTNLHLAYLRNSAEIKSMPSRLIGSWRPYDCDVTHTWVNGTVPIAVAAVFGGFLTFIWFCYLIYATITSSNDGDRRKIAMPFMTNYVCNCTVS